MPPSTRTYVHEVRFDRVPVGARFRYHKGSFVGYANKVSPTEAVNFSKGKHVYPPYGLVWIRESDWDRMMLETVPGVLMYNLED